MNYFQYKLINTRNFLTISFKYIIEINSIFIHFQNSTIPIKIYVYRQYKYMYISKEILSRNIYDGDISSGKIKDLNSHIYGKYVTIHFFNYQPFMNIDLNGNLCKYLIFFILLFKN